MPKVVESKMVFKGEDQISATMDKINESIKTMGGLAKEAAENLAAMMDAAMGGTGAPRGGRGRAAQGSQRSPNAPPQGGGGPSSKGSGRGAGGGGGGGGGGDDKGFRPFPGWHSWLKFAGMGMAGGGAMLGATTGQATPAVAGMMSAVGSAIAPISALGLPVGAIPGVAMMAGGAAMQLTSQIAQPAIQHYKQYGDIYRRLERAGGQYRGEEVREAGRWAGFSPDESMRYAGELAKVGAGAGYETMAGMRMGGFEPEDMMGYMTTATKAGAAGGRKREDYDYLGKVIGRAFSKESGIPSMSQAINSMAGLMGTSEGYLADLSKDQTRSLAAYTQWAEKSGTALLKGERGQKFAGSVWSAIATPGEPATEQYLYNVMGHGMDYFDWMKKREEGLAGQGGEEFLQDIARRPMKEGATLLHALTKGGVSFTQGEAVWKEMQTGGLKAAKAYMSEQGIAGEKIDYKFDPNKKSDEIQVMEALLAAKRLEVSESGKIVKSYEKMENAFLEIGQKMLRDGGMVDKAIVNLAWSLDQLSKHLGRPIDHSGEWGRLGSSPQEFFEKQKMSLSHPWDWVKEQMRELFPGETRAMNN